MAIKLINPTFEERHKRALASGPECYRTFRVWQECLKSYPRVKIDKRRGDWTVERILPTGEVVPLRFGKLIGATRIRTYAILQMMARQIPLKQIELSMLPRIYEEEWLRLAQDTGVIPRKTTGGKWSDDQKARASKASKARWRERKARDADETLPPVSSLTERATIKLLARLRRLYPAAPESTLQTLARLDAGTL